MRTPAVHVAGASPRDPGSVPGAKSSSRWARAALLLFALFAGAVVLPDSAAAQEIGTDCTLEDWLTIRSNDPVPGRRITYVSRPVIICPDGTRLSSDSAVVYQEYDRAELIGRVRYQTADRRLESTRADYSDRDGRLEARGSVVFEDLDRGTVLTGERLTRLTEGPQRPEELVTVGGARPRALLPPRTDAGPEGEPSPAYQVTADELRFEGEQFFWADGDVEVVRDRMSAFSDSLAFDQGAGQLFLNGNARVDAEESTMTGQRIRMALPGDVLESVTITGRGTLTTEELEVVGDEIRITLLEERIERMVSVRRTAEREERVEEDAEDRGEEVGMADGPPRPRATTEDFVLEGDSLDVRSPGEVLESVTAVGNARGESRERGATVATVPVPDEEPVEEEAAAIEAAASLTDSDWIVGDEIVALFEPVASAEVAPADPLTDPDEAPPVRVGVEEEDDAPRYQLQSLQAKGNARTLYRSPPRSDDEDADPEEREDVARWSISYIVAGEIIIHMVGGEVDRLEAKEKVEGIQLEPVRREPPAEDGAASAPGSVDTMREGTSTLHREVRWTGSTR